MSLPRLLTRISTCLKGTAKSVCLSLSSITVVPAPGGALLITSLRLSSIISAGIGNIAVPNKISNMESIRGA